MVVIGSSSAWGDAAAQGYDYPPINPYAATVVGTEITVLRAIGQRSQIGLRYHQSGPPFEYDLVRLLYTRKRQLEIKR